MEKIKKCPFNKEECTDSCSLYIKPDELNETVRNKLASIGLIDKNQGICSLKNISLCMSRYMFENTGVYNR